MKKFPLFVLWLAVACTEDVVHLTGAWKPVAYYENGQSLAAPLDSVALVFTENGLYEYRSIGFYHEAGPFRLDGKLLFLSDTTEKPAKERVVKILFLSADTLKIQMKKAEQEQVLFLKKQS